MSKRDPDDEALAMLGFESTTPNTQALITRIKALRELAEKATPGPDGIVDADWSLACVLIKARETLSWGYQHTKTPERKNYTHYPVPAFDLCLAEAKAVRRDQSAAMIELYDAVLKVLEGQ